METVLHIKQGFGAPIGGIEIKVDFEGNRQLSDMERLQLSKKIDEFLSFYVRESLLSDPKTKKDIEIEKESIIALFNSESIYVKEIANQYNSHSIYPWYEVTTKKGIIIIGWRKRVISIDWSKSDIKLKAEEFTTEDVTKYDKCIHAWGYEKAFEYLNKLLNS